MPRFVRAGRPRSRGAFSPDVVTPTSQYCRSIRAPLVIEGAPSLFVPIRVHSWFVFISKTKTAGCFTLYDPSRRWGRGVANHSSGSPVKLLKNPRRLSLGLVGRKDNVSRLNP